MKITPLQVNEAVKSAGDKINYLLEKTQVKPFLFLTSGGSCLKILEYIDTKYFGPQSTVAVIDERYSTDENINNFSQFKKTEFYKSIKALGVKFINTEILPDESLEESADRFEKSLRDATEKCQENIFATIGIGEDAHTSGIMPFPEDPEYFEKTFNDENVWVVGYDAKNKSQFSKRISTTLPFLRKVNSPVIFSTGHKKKEALLKLLDKNGSLEKSPCRVWREIENVEVFTDQDVS